jgi:hypothetical protein
MKMSLLWHLKRFKIRPPVRELWGLKGNPSPIKKEEYVGIKSIV